MKGAQLAATGWMATWLFALLMSALAPLASAHTESPTLVLQDQTWTVMVYMAADALPELPWDDDINEMECVDQPDGMNIVALVDLYGPDNTMLLDVQHDPNGLDPTIVSEVVPYDAEVDMAWTGTLTHFIETAASMHPADRYVLDLWGHGAGWRGVCLDGYDLLTLPELGMALRNATEAIGQTIDMVIIDSCAEGTLECMYEIMGYADYLVASEKNVQASGLPYAQVLGALAADLDQSPKDFGIAAVDEYTAWAHYGSFYSTTMALCDLAEVDLLVDRLGILSEHGYRYDRLFGDVMRGAAIDAESYDDDWAFDLGDFVGRLLRADLPLEIKDSVLGLVPAYQDAIVHFNSYSHPDPVDGQSVEDASGVAAYAPSAYGDDVAYADLRIALTPWYDFGLVVRSDDETWPNETSVEVALYDSPYDDDDFADTATLTWHDFTGPEASFQAWVFGSYCIGVSLLQTETSTTPVISIEDFFGTLVIAASASLGDSAISYEELTIKLNGTIGLDVEVDRVNVPQVEGYEVALLLPDGEQLSLDPIADRFHRDLKVPSEVDLGSMYVIRVIEVSSGTVVGETRTVLWGANMSISVEVRPASEGRDYSTYIAFASLAVVSTAALAAYAFFRSRARNP